jgi:hypothetical protein
MASTAGLLLAMSGAFAQSAAAATPTPFLQDSTIVGAGGTLTATRVPVETSTGSVVCQDVTIQFNASTKGALTLAPGYPKIQPCPPLITSNFLAGNYAGPPTIVRGKYLVTVGGPAAGPGSSTAWSLVATNGADLCTVPVTATWYTGPIANNPLAPRLKKAGITTTEYSYGIVGVGPPCIDSQYDRDFAQNGLIGAKQIGQVLQIFNFTDFGNDLNVPNAMIAYTLRP